MPSSPLTIGSGAHRVIALHGWFGSARGWGALPEYLDGSNYTYAFMDLRGYGTRQRMTGAYTMAEAADDALAFADELGWDRFSLIGHSMSGQVIQHVLLRAPERVRRLVAVNPVPAAGMVFDEAAWALFSGAAASRDNRAAIIDMTTGNRLTATFVEALVRHSLRNATVEALGTYLESWAKDDFSARVRGNPAAVKVVVGEHDPALSASLMTETWMSYYPNAELQILANAGHYPMFETPVALATAAEEFLGRE